MIHKIAIKGHGQLRHCFFGTYSAVIAIDFGTEPSATQALSVLGAPWKLASKPHALVCQVSTDELDTVTEQLVSFGADGSKIASLARSIDFGEPFEVSIDVENVNQLALA